MSCSHKPLKLYMVTVNAFVKRNHNSHVLPSGHFTDSPPMRSSIKVHTNIQIHRVSLACNFAQSILSHCEQLSSVLNFVTAPPACFGFKACSIMTLHVVSIILASSHKHRHTQTRTHAHLHPQH